MRICCLLRRCLLLVGVWFAGLSAVDPDSLHADTVNGYLINPFTDQPLPQVDIAFLVRQNGQLSEMLRKPTDDQGRFAFSGPFLNADLEFFLVAFYKGVPYPTSALTAAAQRQIILEAYEPGDDDSQIHVTANQLFFLLGEEEIEAAQSLHIENLGEKTYVGQGQGQARRVTQVALPSEGVFRLQGRTGKLNSSADGRVFDNQPLPPGSTQIAISYNLDPHQFSDGYVHSIIYPTASLEIFLRPATLTLKPPFEDLGTIEIQQQNYRHYLLNHPTQGQDLIIPLPLSNAHRWLLKWLALSLALVATVAALAWAQPAKPGVTSQIPDRPVLERQLQDILAALAQLDDTYAGQPHRRRYRVTREQLVRQALSLYRFLEESSEEQDVNQ